MPWTKLQADAVHHFPPPEEGRILSFQEALLEAHSQALASDTRVIVMGEGVDDRGGTFGTTAGLQEMFGEERVFDLPIAENGMTGVALGAAVTGLRPVFVHMRSDFMLMCMDQIVNHLAKWKYMFDGRQSAPVVIRSIIGRGWGSACQHTQSLQGLFMHVPGLKVAMPYGAYDAKGLFLQAVADDSPVIFIEHRWAYGQREAVPEAMYLVPFGQGRIRRKGKHATIAAISLMVKESLEAAEKLAAEGISAEVIDLRTIKPWDEELVLSSVRKTGRLIVADTGNIMAGFTAEIAATVQEKSFSDLKSPVLRIGLPDVPCPSSPPLEARFYPGAEDIVRSVKTAMGDH